MKNSKIKQFLETMLNIELNLLPSEKSLENSHEFSPEFESKINEIPKKKRRNIWKPVTALLTSLALLFSSTSIFQFFNPSQLQFAALATSNKAEEMSVQDKNNFVASEAFKTYEKNINSFSNKLFPLLTKDLEDSNFIFSPASVHQLSLQLTNITDGNTKKQLNELLGETDVATMNENSRIFNRYFTLNIEPEYQYDPDIKRSMFNSFWFSKTHAEKFNKDPLENLAYNFYSDSYSVDFTDKRTKKEMNKWIFDHTNGLLGTKGASLDVPISNDSVLYLLSGIYVKDAWRTPFENYHIINDTFTNSKGKKINTTFMNAISDDSYYFENNDYAVSSKKLNEHKMVFVLPKDKNLDTILKNNNLIEDINTIVKEKKQISEDPYLVDLKIPKFNIANDIDLKDIYNSLGVTDIFDTYSADFSPIYKQNLYTNKLGQLNNFFLDEKGIEAASLTYSNMEKAAVGVEDEISPKIYEFYLDKPFIFILYDYNNIPMFIGVMNNI